MKDLCDINKCLKLNNYSPIEKIGNINNWTMYRSKKEVGDKKFFFITSKDEFGELGDLTIELRKILYEIKNVKERNYKHIAYEITINVDFDVFRDISKCEEYLLKKLDEITK